MVTDLLVIGGISAFLAGMAYFFFHRETVGKEQGKKFTYGELRDDVVRMVNDYVSTSVSGMGLSKEMVRNQERQRRRVARSVRTCTSGNAGARAVVKDLIYNYLVDRGVDESNIDYTIPYSQPKLLTARQMMEIMVYMKDRGGEEGFLKLHQRYDFTSPKSDGKGNVWFELSEADIRRMYALECPSLGIKDKRGILAQMLYSDSLGLGAIDTLNYQKGCIEEIQVGLAGRQQQAYNYKDEIRDSAAPDEALYSRNAIHVLIRGIGVRMSFLGFGSENEMQRVLRNLIKDSSAGELTIDSPQAIVEAEDGRRIAVSRPPMSDGWVGLIRKFDTLMVTDLDAMYSGREGSAEVNEVIRSIVHTGFNVAFTGEMESGKTSMFRAALAETRPEHSIRVIESGSFELNVRSYMPARNSLSLRVTRETGEKEVAEFIRKTTGQIFCVGEVSSLPMANLTMNLAKISQQTFFSAHYVTTDDMVQDFLAAKICEGHFTNERLAELDAVRCLQFDIHIRMVRGERYVQYINEVVPEPDFLGGFDTEEITEGNAAAKTAEGIREVRRQLGRARTYSVRNILEYDEEGKKYVFRNRPSARCYEKARWYMTKEQYQDFCGLFGRLVPERGEGNA